LSIPPILYAKVHHLLHQLYAVLIRTSIKESSKNRNHSSFPVAVVFWNWHFLVPEDCTLVLHRDGDVPLIFLLIKTENLFGVITVCRSQWPRGLRRKYAATHLLSFWVHISPGAWMFVCCECCVLSGRGICDELITHPEQSYRMWCVVVCDLETSYVRRLWPIGDCRAKNKNNNNKTRTHT